MQARAAPGTSKGSALGFFHGDGYQIAAEYHILTVSYTHLDVYKRQEYYRLRFVLTNNSDQDIFIAGWNLGVAPAKGDRYAVDVWEPWDENVTMETEPCVPVGCIGDVELILEVDPEEMEGKTVQITLDPYGEMPLKLGEVELP